MRLAELPFPFESAPGPPATGLAEVTADQWQTTAGRLRSADATLVALWAADRRDLHDGFEVRAAYALEDGLACLRLSLPAEAPDYPDLAEHFPAAGRMQRAAFDLTGVAPLDPADGRPWLRHGAWPAGVHPLRRDVVARSVWPAAPDDYTFVSVSGDGVHEIPVGPVHAGTIEPGHFRFSVVGERVLRLEARLGYTHKGIEKRFESMTLDEGAALAGRVSGDSTVAFAWAYAMAVEQLSGASVPPRAAAFRAMLLERERVANHLGDLGALGNDAGFAFGLAQFSRLKEDWLRTNGKFWGHRYLMDRIVPGGLSDDLDDAHLPVLARQVQDLADEVARLRRIYDEHGGLQDRLRDCGVVSNDLARRLGLTGLAARASGMAVDLRVGCPVAPYDALAVRCATRSEGDVAARTAVRFDEVMESLRLIGLLAETLPDGPTRVAVPSARQGACGIGRLEGWRGEVLVFVEAGADGRIRRCHPHDPSWQNWPLLEHAILGNIVPDFPLINKSFNLSYSGVDL
jgi:Ni,Fe-hydrogenase III large subunit/Ni,Fe-hydrogenase III component G